MTEGRRPRVRSALVLACALGIVPQAALAHSFDAATLILTEVSEGKFAIDWQTTASSLKDLREPALYPEPCRQTGTWLDCGPLGLVGSIEFPWLAGGESRVTVLIDWRSGARSMRIVNGRSPRMSVYGIPSSAGLRFLQPIALDYTRFGIEHILSGFDHLLFVLAITILVPRRRPLIAAITAFTVAHSLTLGATVLGWLSLPSAVVEPLIALSIVLACAECLRPSDSLAKRAPWLITFAFGLLHGMGFASALLETGLPEKHVPSALLFFNVGVELGQLLAITLFVAAGWLWGRIERRPAWASRAFIYALGCTAAYWSLERGAALFSS